MWGEKDRKSSRCQKMRDDLRLQIRLRSVAHPEISVTQTQSTDRQIYFQKGHAAFERLSLQVSVSRTEKWDFKDAIRAACLSVRHAGARVGFVPLQDAEVVMYCNTNAAG